MLKIFCRHGTLGLAVEYVKLGTNRNAAVAQNIPQRAMMRARSLSALRSTYSAIAAVACGTAAAVT
jgi:hypothetical protein